MNRREFLKTTSSITAGAMLTQAAHAEGAAPASTGGRTNWAGTYTFTAPKVDHAVAVDDVQHVLLVNRNAKALGAGHSFNSIADTAGDQIQMMAMRGMTMDKRSATVRVAAGMTYGEFAPDLDDQGFALHNMASLPHVTVAGACATGTHGSGVHNGCLSTAVVAMDLVDADGKVQTFSRAGNPDIFPGMVVAMGALGIVTQTTLRLMPRFEIAQVVYENLPFEQLEHSLEAIFSAGYSVSLFTTWQEHRAQQVWLKQVPGPGMPPKGQYPPMFYGATLQTKKLHPVLGLDATPCTEQFGERGPWFERLPHFRVNFTPSSGNEIQTEYFVARKDAYQAIRAVEALRDRITPHLLITELRCVAADDLWMSMAYQRDSLAIHFTWKPEMAAVTAVLPLIERALKPFQPRPHWAKVNTIPAAELKAAYPRYADFQALMKRFDPKGTFRNAYLERVFAG